MFDKSDDPIDLDKEEVEEVDIVPGSELGNMFLVEVNGEIKEYRNNPKNRLLFKHGLYEFLYGGDNEKRILSEDPYVCVRPLSTEDEYRLWYDSKEVGVTVPPSKSEKLLRGIADFLDSENPNRIEEVYSDIIENQVRRPVVNSIAIIYPQQKVVPAQEGWIINGLFKLTWDANVYLIGKDLDEGDFTRAGGGITRTDNPQDFLELKPQDVPEPKTIKVDGKEYEMTELEMEFLAKVEYLLEFEEHIDDPAFVEVLKRDVRGEINYADADDRFDNI